MSLRKSPGVNILTEAVCSWPGDAVSIRQRIMWDDPTREDTVNMIGLDINEIDDLVIQLLQAKAQAQKAAENYAAQE